MTWLLKTLMGSFSGYSVKQAGSITTALMSSLKPQVLTIIQRQEERIIQKETIEDKLIFSLFIVLKLEGYDKRSLKL